MQMYNEKEQVLPMEWSVPKEQQQIKAYATVTQGEGQNPAQAGSRMWRHQPNGSGFRVTKETDKKGLWNPLPWLRKDAEDRHVAVESLNGGP